MKYKYTRKEIVEQLPKVFGYFDLMVDMILEPAEEEIKLKEIKPFSCEGGYLSDSEVYDLAIVVNKLVDEVNKIRNLLKEIK